MGMLAIAIIVNTVLGSLIANRKNKFSWKKLFRGLLKSIIIALCMLAFCLTLELVPAILSRIGINVPEDIITVLEMAIMLFTAYKKYITDCIDKFKTILGVRESE
jgi:hypothetical protein